MSLNSTRRQILAYLGAAPVVAPSALKELAAITSSPSAKALMAGSQLMGGMTLNSAAMPQQPSSPLFAQVQSLLQQLYQEQENRRWTGGKLPIDSDISALRSVSPSYRDLMQKTRDNERAALIQAAHKLLNGQFL